jgi:hypothetical protein
MRSIQTNQGGIQPMNRDALLQEENVSKFLGETSDEERARVLRIASDFQLVASAMEFAKGRVKSSGRDPTDEAKQLFGEPLDAALKRLSGDGPFLQGLMSRLGEKGFEAVVASDAIGAHNRVQLSGLAVKFPTLYPALNDQLASLAHSGTIMMTCGGAAAMIAGGALAAMVGAEAGGAIGLAGVFAGGAVFGAGVVYASVCC